MDIGLAVLIVVFAFLVVVSLVVISFIRHSKQKKKLKDKQKND